MVRKISNPLALAVLALLWERPMYPYEITSTLRERHKEESIRLNYGSLYAVIKQLEKHGFIAHNRVEREGKRPERIVYEITDTGRDESVDWLSDILSTPAKEFPRFEAGLSLLPLLPPEQAIRLLTDRLTGLGCRLESLDRDVARAADVRFPELLMIETQFQQAILHAEREFTAALIKRIKSGELGGSAFWNRMHELIFAGHTPSEIFTHPHEFFGEEAVALFPTNPEQDTKGTAEK